MKDYFLYNLQKNYINVTTCHSLPSNMTKILNFIATTIVVVACASPVFAQTNAAVTDTNVATVAAPQVNAAIVPVSRTGTATNRQSVVLQRAKDNPGDYDILFVGDSITQGWEGAGKSTWEKYYGQRKCLMSAWVATAPNTSYGVLSRASWKGSNPRRRC